MRDRIDWRDVAGLQAGEHFTIDGMYRPRPLWKRLWWRLRYFQSLPKELQEFKVLYFMPDDKEGLLIEQLVRDGNHETIH